MRSASSLRSSSSVRHSIARVLGLAAVSVAALSSSGCGSSEPVAMPEAVLGTYGVEVEVEGKTDSTIMSVVKGSGTSVLLTFSMGISPVRCTVKGMDGLTAPRQLIELLDAPGRIEATAQGSGTITADGTVDITLNVVRADVSTPQADADAGVAAGVPYHITGTRQ